MLHPGFIEPCLPMMSRTVPTGGGWAYEIKHDGFRFICRRDGDRVCCYSRGGHDWSAQLPAIAEAMRAFPVTSVTLDGEVVICGADGVFQFDRMNTVFGRRGSREAFLYAFDIFQDLREECWDDRRELLALFLTGADEGIRLCEHIEGTDGAVVFRAACNMGLEGIVAKRRDSRYRSGCCRDWVKNIAHSGDRTGDADRPEQTAAKRDPIGSRGAHQIADPAQTAGPAHGARVVGGCAHVAALGHEHRTVGVERIVCGSPCDGKKQEGHLLHRQRPRPWRHSLCRGARSAPWQAGFSLGSFRTIEEAKQTCERHYANAVEPAPCPLAHSCTAALKWSR
jgi:ATP dependent DNA ligase domain